MSALEDIVDKLDPTTRWEQCHASPCVLENYDSFKGVFVVPASYKEPEGAQITVTAQKFTTKNTVKPKAHMILLSGGPGYPGRTYDDTISSLLQSLPEGDLACYTIDHRGLGESSPLSSSSTPQENIFNNLPDYLLKGPFPGKDLTLQNASADVGVLARVIRDSPDADPEARIVLYGFSYGAQWAHLAACLFPNTFDAMVIGGVPRFPGIHYHTLHGLAENCRLDPYCRSKMGGNVYGEMRKAILNVINPDHNECTAAFNSFLRTPFSGSASTRVSRLANVFCNMTRGRSKMDTIDFSISQVVLPFLKATSDCIYPDAYVEEVLAPIYDELIAVKRSAAETARSQKGAAFNTLSRTPKENAPFLEGDSKKAFNILVNTLVFFDKIDTDYTKELPMLPADLDDVHTWSTMEWQFYTEWEQAAASLEGYERTKQAPLKSKRTSVYIASSLMDTNTTIQVAWDLYNRIGVPLKRFLRFDSRLHDGHFGACKHRIFLEAIYNLPPQDLTDCIKRDNLARRRDWHFARNPDLQQIWEHVVPGPDIPDVPLDIPCCVSSGGPAAVVAAPSRDVAQVPVDLGGGTAGPRARKLGRYIILVGVVVGMALLAAFAYRAYRRRAAQERQEQWREGASSQ